MTQDKSGSQDRAETRAARAAERADTAGQVWEEVKAREAARDDQIVRLKAERLARDAEDAAAPKPAAKATKATKVAKR
ncbi:hypothetical protein [Methylobacterium sp. Leaf100]|uniref:hypothetical protein n=1 Tax=Methylobacterium sp. Leaf100 TaxID=1736252 RepID=UPI000700D1A8|nr:hypothetical protein [Methylobacterium sp. Leaf100]KQP34828.1 hypothetical protein ASF25_16050 [Methylobacterium sp. Leaf100]